MIYPIQGGAGEAPLGVEAGEWPVCWRLDGRSLYVRTPNPPPIRIFRVDLATGARELWKEIGPSDPSGLIGIFELHVAPEAGAYAFTYGRILSELFLAEGIK